MRRRIRCEKKVFLQKILNIWRKDTIIEISSSNLDRSYLRRKATTRCSIIRLLYTILSLSRILNI